MPKNHKITVHENKWFKLTRFDEKIDGKTYERYTLERGAGVGMMQVDSTGKLYFISQYRYTTGIYSLDFPAGIVDKGETLKQAAERELREESGIVASNLTRLGKIFVAPGTSNQVAEIFVAQIANFADSQHEATEKIKSDLICLDKEEIFAKIRSGEISGSFTLAILALYFAWTDSISPNIVTK